jgi:hypothetical protein
MTDAEDRAAEVIAGQSFFEMTPDSLAEALAAADPPLLITYEIQAVLDAAIVWVSGLSGNYVAAGELADAVNAYLASRGDR